MLFVDPLLDQNLYHGKYHLKGLCSWSSHRVNPSASPLKARKRGQDCKPANSLEFRRYVPGGEFHKNKFWM